MGGKFVVRAGQHKFESGEKVISPTTVLPTAPNTYSHKVNYKFEYTDGTGNRIDGPDGVKKQVFVVEDVTSKLITQRDLNNSTEDTTLRFHTAEAKPFKAMLFNSENVKLDKPDDPFFNEEKADDEPSLNDQIFKNNSNE